MAVRLLVIYLDTKCKYFTKALMRAFHSPITCASVRAGVCLVFPFIRQEQVHFKMSWACVSVLWVIEKARDWGGGGAPTNQTACTVLLKSVYHRPPTHTHTHTPGSCVSISHSFYISLFSLFSFQEPGARSHLLIGFAEETYSLVSFSSIPQGSLPRWFPCLGLLPTQSSFHQSLLFFWAV